jgi:GNAT superfamily N-acetyltransferase
MARWASLLRLPPEYVRDNEVFVATRDRIVGFYALILRRSLPTLDHPWVLPPCIGQGIGGAVFADVLAHAAQLGAQVIEIEADPNAVGFYAHMGARQVRDTIGDMGRVLLIMAIDLPACSGSWA